jgi:hypothetical protein
MLPVAGTTPTEGWMVQVDTCAVLQERVTGSPGYLGMAGEAVNESIRGAWKRTAALPETDFRSLVAVRVYVVGETVGTTVLDPVASTVPNPVSDTVSAHEVLQLSVEDCPGSNVFGEAESHALGS